MANLKERGGRIRIRVGGNTQETATLVDSLPNNAMIAKDTLHTSNPVSNCKPVPQLRLIAYTQTGSPPLLFTREVLYLMSNISQLVNVQWYLGSSLKF
jgi:hypothetical protein